MQKLASTCKYCAVLFCVGTECQYGPIYFTHVSKIALKVRAKQKTQILHQGGDKLHVCTCVCVCFLSCRGVDCFLHFIWRCAQALGV